MERTNKTFPGAGRRNAEEPRRHGADQGRARLRTLMRPHYGIALEDEALPQETKPNRIWKVDWPKVAEAERWLAMQAPDRPIETAVAEATPAPVRIAAAGLTHTPARDPCRPETGPTDALNVFGVLAARCAGHRDCPEAAEVVEGIANRAPTER